MSFDLAVTLAVLCAALAGAGGVLRYERRERPPGEPRLVPTTPLLFVCVLVIVLALAHLVTLVTGTPHKGRLG